MACCLGRLGCRGSRRCFYTHTGVWGLDTPNVALKECSHDPSAERSLAGQGACAARSWGAPDDGAATKFTTDLRTWAGGSFSSGLCSVVLLQRTPLGARAKAFLLVVFSHHSNHSGGPNEKQLKAVGKPKKALSRGARSLQKCTV